MTQQEIQQITEAISQQATDITEVTKVTNPTAIANVLSIPGIKTDSNGTPIEYVAIPFSALVALATISDSHLQQIAQSVAEEVVTSQGVSGKTYITITTPNGQRYLLMNNGIVTGCSTNLPGEWSNATDITNQIL